VLSTPAWSASDACAFHCEVPQSDAWCRQFAEAIVAATTETRDRQFKQENHVGQAELEIQLKVWKKLAVSKQMLIGAATDALGLDAECSREELKEALDSATQRAIEADVNVKRAKEEADAAISDMQKKLTRSEKALVQVQATLRGTLAEKLSVEERMATARAAGAQDIKKLTAQLAEKQKALKAINVALADTPENVAKKLKSLKKDKLDEANARKRVENDLRSVRKDKQNLDKRLSESETALKKGAELIEQYRALRKVCETQQEQLGAHLEDGQSLPDLPELDEELIEAIEKASGGETKNEKEKEKK